MPVTVPQRRQNFAPGVSDAWQLAQDAPASGAPQLAQNFPAAAAPQEGQVAVIRGNLGGAVLGRFSRGVIPSEARNLQ